MSSPQFDLFGDPITPNAPTPSSRTARAASAAPKVLAASHDDTLRVSATKLPSDVFLGTSSWSFSGWHGLVYDAAYPEQTLSRSGLSAYAEHPLFRSVGIDRTFYAPISEDEFRRYAKQIETAEKPFRFLVKAPMAFTGPRLRSDDGLWADNPQFLDATHASAQFVEPATRGLLDRCGPLVFQFPPLGPRFTRAPQRFADQLAEFLLALPKLSLPACYAVELRDPELLTEDYLAALNAANATHCIGIHARMPMPETQSRFWREASRRLPLVIRWSLHSGFKYEEAKERYAPFNALIDIDDAGLEQVGALIEEAHATSRASFVIVNNKAEGSAPLTVARIAKLLATSAE